MSDLFNDKHLLWWVIKAIIEHDSEEAVRIMESLYEPSYWNYLGAPEWVLPAIREKITIFERENHG